MQRNFSIPAASSKTDPVEIPTLLVTMAIYGSWVALTLFHASVPTALLALCGGIVIAWHGSLQHETIHGHPTRIAWLNAAIGFIPLSLWLPYAVYRRTHVAHHETANITDPFDDPESQYLAGRAGVRYWLARAEATLLGRLLLGPAIRIGHFLVTEARRGLQDPRDAIRDWLPHLAGVAAILLWLRHCDLPLGTYLMAFVYPGTSFSLLRSFAEHRADADRSARAAIIPKPGPFGLLFLNNNLHAVHHAHPGLPWYRLPAFYRAHRQSFSGPHYASYATVARRFLLKRHDHVLHPDHAVGQQAG